MPVQKKFDFTQQVIEPTTLMAVWDCSPGWGTIYYNDDSGAAKTYELINLDDLDPLYDTSSSTTKVINFYGLSVKKNQITRVDIGSKVEIIKDSFCAYLTKCEEVNLGINIKEIGKYFCRNCSSLVKFGGFPATVEKTNLYFLYRCIKFNQPISYPANPNWNGNLGNFLYGCSSFNQPIPDTFPASVTNLGGFLSSCSSFNQPIPDTFPASVTDLSVFLYDCSSFNQPIPDTFPASVTNLSNFLSGCSSFNQPIPDTFPASVTNLSVFLYGCSSFNQPIPDTFPASVTNLSNFLSGCSSFNQPIPDTFPASVTSLGGFLSGCSSFNQPIPDTFPASVTDLSVFLYDCSSFNQPIPDTFPASVTSLGGFLSGCSSFNQPIPDTFPASVTSLGDFLSGCSSFNQPIPQVIPAKVKTLMNWTKDWHAFDKQLPPIPATVTTLSEGCFANLWSYTKDIIIPATITKVNTYSSGVQNYHIFGTTSATQGYTGIVHWETTAVPSGNATFTQFDFSCSSSKSPAYTQGIRVTGAGADALIAALPNKDNGAPYRKLVKV